MNKNSDLYKELQGAYIQACDTYSSNITELYTTLNSIYQKYRRMGEAKSGEEFIFETSMGISLRLKFFLRGAEVYSRNINTNDKEVLVLSAEQSEHKNFEALNGMSVTLQSLGLSIGPSFPKDFRDKINQMKPGTVLYFSGGKAYACEKNDEEGHVILTPIYHGSNLRKLSIEDFQKQDSITIDTLSPGDLQKLYQTNKNKLSHSVENEYSFLEKSHRQIATIEGDVSRLHSKKVKIGSLSFVVKKAMVGDAILWYGPDGAVVGQEQVAYLISYLNTNPIQTKYKRKEPTYRKTAEDAIFRKDMEKLLDCGFYAEVYSQMCNYSKDNFDDLIIQTDSFLRDSSGEYKAGTIVFRNGEAFQISYENNDFSKDTQVVSRLTLENFKAFCEQKYTDTFERTYADSLSTIYKKYHAVDEQVLKNQAAVAKRMAESKMKTQEGTVLTSEDFHKGSSGFEDLIDNLKEDDPTIQIFLKR